MAKMLSYMDVKRQSEQVFGQFGESKWIPYAKENVLLPRRDCRELENIGLGRTMLLVAMGESTEEQIEMIKKHRDKVLITTCDKGFGMLLEHGVKADYVVLCDCNIPYRWLEKYINETKDVKLLATPYANPEWTRNWKGDRYFFVNRDALKTERIFLDIFNDETIRTMPAGSNVSNAMLVFWTGSDETKNTNFGGFEKYLLTGYDYSWRPTGHYYAFSDPRPKRFYMNHRTVIDYRGNIVNTSENLLFSAKWLYTYITVFGLPVVNCSERGLLDIPHKNDIEAEFMKANADQKAIENIRSLWGTMQGSYRVFDDIRRNFNKAREALNYGYR